MKFFRTEQIRAIDEATIALEPISSINLMERAATQLTDVIAARYGGGVYMFAIFAGPGNNGGDALAVARMLNDRGENVAVWLVAPQRNLLPDCRQNLERLRKTNVPVTICDDSFSAPVLPPDAVVIDGLFGSGLSRPVTALYATVIDFINGSGCKVVSIDIPSGLHGEKLWDVKVTSIVRASFTLTLQFPKLSLMLPENEEWVGGWEIVDISLSEKAIEEQPAGYYYTDFDEIKSLIKPRRKFSHKGDYGRALLVAGSLGMAGASTLAARSALRSGVGLLTLFIPQCNNVIVQKSVPEAMTQPFGGDVYITEVPETALYSAVGVGPGLGTRAETSVSLLQTIEKSSSLSIRICNADVLSISIYNALTSNIGSVQ